MTVFVYVTSRQVGDAEHIKVFANTDAAEADARYCLSCGPGLRTSCNGSTMRRGIWY